MDERFFKVLSESEAEPYRRWARENYWPGEEINPTWHPAVREECERMNAELAAEVKLGDAHPTTAEFWGGRLVSAKREQIHTGAWVDVLTYHTGHVAISTDDHYVYVHPSREAWERGDRPVLTFDMC